MLHELHTVIQEPRSECLEMAHSGSGERWTDLAKSDDDSELEDDLACVSWLFLSTNLPRERRSR
jgi:hypothetical protein